MNIIQLEIKLRTYKSSLKPYKLTSVGLWVICVPQRVYKAKRIAKMLKISKNKYKELTGDVLAYKTHKECMKAIKKIERYLIFYNK